MSDFLFKKWHMRRLGIANWKGYRVGRHVWHYNLLTLILPLPLSDQFCLGSSISERIGLAPGQHAGTLKSMSTHGSARPDAPPCIGDFSLPPRFAQDLSKTNWSSRTFPQRWNMNQACQPYFRVLGNSCIWNGGQAQAVSRLQGDVKSLYETLHISHF